MVRQSEVQLQKHTLNLRSGDWEALAAYYPDIPTSNVVRMIVSRYVEQIEEHGASVNAKVEIKL